MLTASIAAVTAVIVAVVTAITTNSRLERQLAAEQDRVASQLGHELRLAELASLREVLDDATIGLNRAKRAHDRVYSLWKGDIAGVMTPEDERRAVFQERRDAMAIARACRDRLSLRLGSDHSAQEQYAHALLCLRRSDKFARDFERGQDTAESKQRAGAAHYDYATAQRAFVGEATKLARAQID